MKYISIGAVMTEGTEHILDVTHGGNKFRLTGEKAALWLNGRCKFASVAHPSHLVTLEQLFKMGLVVKCDGSGAEEYRALTKCTLVPAESKHPYFGLWGMEKTVLQWLRSAGLVLSIIATVFGGIFFFACGGCAVCAAGGCRVCRPFGGGCAAGLDRCQRHAAGSGNPWPRYAVDRKYLPDL